MGYAEHNLISGETIQYKGHLHWIAMMKRVLVAAVLCAIGIGSIVVSFSSNSDSRNVFILAGLFLIFVSGIVAFVAVLLRRAAEFVITNKRVIIKLGFLHKRTIEIFLTKIESVEVSQSLIGRILGFGSISVKGTGGTTEPFPQIADPFEFRRQVQEQEQKQIGLVSEMATTAK